MFEHSLERLDHVRQQDQAVQAISSVEQEEGFRLKNHVLFNKENDWYLKKQRFGKATFVNRKDKKQVIIVKKNRIKFSKNLDDVSEVVKLAKDQGWQVIGLPKGKRNKVLAQKLWLEANKIGLETKGYEPTQRDLDQLDREKQSQKKLDDLAKKANDKDIKVEPNKEQSKETTPKKNKEKENSKESETGKTQPKTKERDKLKEFKEEALNVFEKSIMNNDSFTSDQKQEIKEEFLRELDGAIAIKQKQGKNPKANILKENTAKAVKTISNNQLIIDMNFQINQNDQSKIYTKSKNVSGGKKVKKEPVVLER